VFLGIESRDALLSAYTAQNARKAESSSDYRLRAVHTIQEHGIEVTAGFIIGLALTVGASFRPRLASESVDSAENWAGEV